MIKRFAGAVVCVLACLLSTSCSEFDSSTCFGGVLSKAHEKSSLSESLSTPQVCILDPAAHAADVADAPKPSTEASPVAEVPETTFDFGKLTDNSEFVHRFSVKNVGKSVLNIKKVVPG